MSRKLPVECPHGRIIEWGDFAPAAGAEPEFCEKCSPLNVIAGIEREYLRGAVWDEMVRRGRADQKVGDRLQAVGLFWLMDVVDDVIDSLYAAATSHAPAPGTPPIGRRMVLSRDEIDGGWIAECSDLPGCLSQGETPAEAARNLADAIAEVLASPMDAAPGAGSTPGPLRTNRPSRRHA